MRFPTAIAALATMAALAMALAAGLATAGQGLGSTPTIYASPVCEFSTENNALRRATAPGAVYELSATVRPEKVDALLTKYAQWYLPVDQFVCPMGDPKCETSGRKLVSLLSRAGINQNSVVFVYRYENTNRQDYYCKFAKAFLRYHTGAKTKDFDTLYQKVRDRRHRDEQMDVSALVAKLPEQCRQLGEEYNLAVDIAQDLVHEADVQMGNLIDSRDGAWYFEIDPCKAAALAEIPAKSPKEIQSMCPEHKESLLQRASGLKWGIDRWEPKVRK